MSTTPEPRSRRPTLRSLWPVLDEVEAVAGGLPVYVVGGAVRDWLLGVDTRDLDLVVAGDAIALASALAARLQVPIEKHSDFGTATLRTPSGIRVDWVAARRERYREPAALPEVGPGSLEQDLARRDFTVNAMALPIAAFCEEELLDPHGGRADLAAGLVRFLHLRSFVDDPTRILRGVRLCAARGLRFEDTTRRSLAEARDRGLLSRLSPQRLRREFWAILEPAVHPERALPLLVELDLLPAIHPALVAPADWAENLRQLSRLESDRALDPEGASWRRFLLLASALPAPAREELGRDWKLSRRQRWELSVLEEGDSPASAAGTVDHTRVRRVVSGADPAAPARSRHGQGEDGA